MSTYDGSSDHERYSRDRSVWKTCVKFAMLGVPKTGHGWYADWQPHCDSPVWVSRRTSKYWTSTTGIKPMEWGLHVACRKCEKCLQFRQLKWKERTEAELALWPRTWWVTLTFDDVMYAASMARAHRDKKPSQSFEAAFDKACYWHVQWFLKRVRKQKCKIRFFSIFERGDEGNRGHYHLFIHEVGGKPVRKRMFEELWPAISHARLYDPDRRGLSAYVTSYSTKSLHVRPRASTRYGKLSPLKN